MKESKICICIALLLVLTTLGMTMFVHAGYLPQAASVNPQKSTVPEVSSDYEVPISFDESSSAPLQLSNKALTLTYKASKKLTANAKDVTWSSSNEKVVRVGQDGTLTATGRGSATVTATAGDGSTASCRVTVRYTIWQWIIMIVLFGWIWY